MKVLIALALLCIAGAYAQDPKCTPPSVWEARMVMFDPNTRHNSSFFETSRYSYDSINLRKRRFEEISFGDGPREYFEVLELFAVKKAYVTNLHTRECKIYPLNEPFIPHTIPNNARFGGYKSLGNGPESILLTEWHGSFNDHHGHPVTTYMTFTSRECVPIRDDRFSQEHGFVYQEFSDTTVGIRDPNVWIPNPNCK